MERQNPAACLGRCLALTLKEARHLVKELRVIYDRGTDPRAYFGKNTSESAMTADNSLTYWKNCMLKER